MKSFPLGYVPTRAERLAAQGRRANVVSVDRALQHPVIASLARYQEPGLIARLRAAARLRYGK